MLHIKDLTKVFHEKTILNKVSLSVARGETAVLLGESGVGKSTLLRILNNLEHADGGSITLDNKQTTAQDLINDHAIGMVFQHFNLFEHMTVEQNITFALEKVLGKNPQEAQAVAHMLLKQYGLFEKKDAYVSQLSGGQKQRLALARALAMKPSIMCLDEPTSALDPFLTSFVASNIQELAQQGYIVLVATHDTSLIEKLDCTLYLMRQGTIVESASSQAYKKAPEQFPSLDKFIKGK